MLVIGTAQFGLDYGINNINGKITTVEIDKIINFCSLNNLTYFDTAQDYGNAEDILSKYDNLNIITKAKFNGKNTHETINNSLSKFKNIYCFLLHSFADYKDDIINTLNEYKMKGCIDNIGISIYNVDEAIIILDDIRINVIQLPINLLDNQWNNPIFLEKLYKRQRDNTIEIHARSIFLQGILLTIPSKLPINIDKKQFIDIDNYMQKLCIDFNISRNNLAFTYINSVKWIDKVIIGIDNVEHLINNYNIYNKQETFTEKELHIITEYQKTVNPLIINPSKWLF